MRSRGWLDGTSVRAATLAKLARRLKAASRWPGSSLPALWMMTDEERHGDPIAAASALPPGSGVVLRHYRSEERAAIARELALVARERSLTLLIGADAWLALAIGAHGVHLPRWALARRPHLPERGLVTISAHSLGELVQAYAVRPHAVFLGPAFATESHKSAQPLGVVRFSALVRQNRLPTIALGGLDEARAHRLLGSETYGIGAIGALYPPTDQS